MGEEKIKKFNNFCLHYLADLDIPKKRYTSSQRISHEAVYLLCIIIPSQGYFHRVQEWTDQRVSRGEKLYSGRTHGVL